MVELIIFILIFSAVFCFPVAILVLSIYLRKMKCPVCDHSFIVSLLKSAVTCPACLTRLLIRNKKLITIDKSTYKNQ
jgi:DNA-directed RNA polymerase subunit RPC12/RpoP